LCRPITFYKIFFLRKIFLSGNGPLAWHEINERENLSRESCQGNLIDAYRKIDEKEKLSRKNLLVCRGLNFKRLNAFARNVEVKKFMHYIFLLLVYLFTINDMHACILT
jgi:hypothetical protein